MNTQLDATLWDDAPAPEALPRALEARLRAAYFSLAGGAALRYRVSVEDVLEHVVRAGIARMPRPERAAEHMVCVVHATALVRGDAQAWTDLVNQLASNFDRACAARLDSVRGIAFARRFWRDLREATASESRNHGARVPDLRTYAGSRPLRYWLAERLLGTLEFEIGRSPRSAPARLDRSAGARTLRMPSSVVTAEAKAR
jgi:hypothetical protein